MSDELICDGCFRAIEGNAFLLALHRFDGGIWEFHATDNVNDDPAPTHIAFAVDSEFGRMVERVLLPVEGA